MLLFAYNLILILFLIPVLAYFSIRAMFRGNERLFAGWKERVTACRYPLTDPEKPVIWIHCASLGEVRAVEPLIPRFKEFAVVMTTLTRTGRDYALRNGITPYVFFAPLDLSFLVKRFTGIFSPRALLIVETEIWPGMISTAAREGVRVIIINGRLSVDSYPYYRSLRAFWRHFMLNIDYIAARSEEDAERFIRLGYPSKRVFLTGNIKYDREFPDLRLKKEDFGFAPEDLLLVCGSTRSDEEAIIVNAWQNLRVKFPRLKLVIAPRHLNRAKAVEKILRGAGIAYCRRSGGEMSGCSCLILDTFGELLKLYSIADVAFVGGSLVPKGGQNPIEPAAYDRPVIFGPSMENFRTEANTLTESGGGFMVKDAPDLVTTLERLFSDPSIRSRAGARAKHAVEKQRGALNRTEEIIRSLINS